MSSTEDEERKDEDDDKDEERFLDSLYNIAKMNHEEFNQDEEKRRAALEENSALKEFSQPQLSRKEIRERETAALREIVNNSSPYQEEEVDEAVWEENLREEEEVIVEDIQRIHEITSGNPALQAGTFAVIARTAGGDNLSTDDDVEDLRKEGEEEALPQELPEEEFKKLISTAMEISVEIKDKENILASKKRKVPNYIERLYPGLKIPEVKKRIFLTDTTRRVGPNYIEMLYPGLEIPYLPQQSRFVGEDDKGENKGLEPFWKLEGSDKDKEIQEVFEEVPPDRGCLGSGRRVVAFLQGAHGLGKTKLAKAVTAKLNECGIQAAYLDQDLFVKGGDEECSEKRFTAQLHRNLMDPGLSVILSARNNASQNDMEDHQIRAKEAGWECVTLYPAHLDSKSENQELLFRLTCLRSMLERTRPHLTFINLLTICRGSLLELQKDRSIPGIPVRWLLPPGSRPNPSTDVMKKVRSYMDFRSGGGEIQALIEDLRLDKVNASSYRMPMDQLVDEVTKALEHFCIHGPSTVDTIEEDVKASSVDEELKLASPSSECKAHVISSRKQDEDNREDEKRAGISPKIERPEGKRKRRQWGRRGGRKPPVEKKEEQKAKKPLPCCEEKDMFQKSCKHIDGFGNVRGPAPWASNEAGEEVNHDHWFKAAARSIEREAGLPPWANPGQREKIPGGPQGEAEEETNQEHPNLEREEKSQVRQLRHRRANEHRPRSSPVSPKHRRSYRNRRGRPDRRNRRQPPEQNHRAPFKERRLPPHDRRASAIVRAPSIKDRAQQLSNNNGDRRQLPRKQNDQFGDRRSAGRGARHSVPDGKKPNRDGRLRNGKQQFKGQRPLRRDRGSRNQDISNSGHRNDQKPRPKPSNASSQIGWLSTKGRPDQSNSRKVIKRPNPKPNPELRSSKARFLPTPPSSPPRQPPSPQECKNIWQPQQQYQKPPSTMQDLYWTNFRNSGASRPLTGNVIWPPAVYPNSPYSNQLNTFSGQVSNPYSTGPSGYPNSWHSPAPTYVTGHHSNNQPYHPGVSPQNDTYMTPNGTLYLNSNNPYVNQPQYHDPNLGYQQFGQVPNNRQHLDGPFTQILSQMSKYPPQR